MEWNTEQLNLKSKYYTVGQEIVRPSAAERDATVNFDRSLWKKVGNTGLFGLCMPEEYGGAGLGIADFGAALEGFSAGCQDMGVLVTLVAQVALEQCQTWLPELISGEKLACFAITEKGCGSDVRSIKTQVDRTDSGYILNGKKWNITNAPVADICMTFGKVVGKQEKSIACFIFNTHSEGIEQSKPFDLMGNRGTPIGSIDFENVALTNENRIGQEEEGLSVLYFSFLVERVLTGILVSGCIAPLIQESVAYSQNRQAFGKAIGDNQYVQQYIVDIESKLELLKGVIFRALSALEKGEDCSKLASIVKMFSAEIFHESSLSAMRVMGNYGYRRENYYERLLRDAIGLLFAGGTAEIHKRVIWDSMVKEFNNENKKRENLKMNWNNAVRDAQETKELEEA